MPWTTPFVPLTVSVLPASPPSAVFVDAASPPTTAAPTQHHDHDSAVFVSTTAPDAARPPSLTTQHPAARPAAHSRRLTLSRFPLLRKGSRELARSPSAHLKASTASAPPPLSSPPPGLSAAHPRASTSSVRPQQPSPARAPSVHTHEQLARDDDDSATKAAAAPVPGKMHQTSSRLLRMTDDERPYTRVRSFTSASGPQTSSLLGHSSHENDGGRKWLQLC